jgi:hypothetical protein
VWTAGLVAVINERVKPMYESSSLLRVEPATTNLFGVASTEFEPFDHFLQTQVELIRSPSVVSTAIASGPKVTGTALLRGSRDPESELRGRLQVGVLSGSYLIRVGLTTPEPADGPAILSEVVKAYLTLANAWSIEKNASRIKRLEKYSLELTEQIAGKQDELIQLAQKGSADLQSTAELLASAPSSASGNDSGLTLVESARISIDEYRQIRQRLFETNLKVIESEELLKKLKGELDQRGAPRSSLRELNEQVDSLKFLKNTYEKLLPPLKLLSAQERADRVRLALVREDLASLRELRSSVEKRIEQLKFDSRGEARINEIDPAKPNSIPINKNARQNLFVLAPVVVLACVLLLFLGLELLSERISDRDEIVPSV